DDGPARPQLAAALGLLDHREPDSVLHAAARVQLLELGEDGRLESARHLLEPHERGVPDEIEDAPGELHVPRPILEAQPRGRGERFGDPGALDADEPTSSGASALWMRERAAEEVNPQTGRMGAKAPPRISRLRLYVSEVVAVLGPEPVEEDGQPANGHGRLPEDHQHRARERLVDDRRQ